MREIRISLNNRPSGLKIAGVSHKEQTGFRERFEEPHENLSPEQRQVRELKKLQDRIKILELELQKSREESFRAGYDEGQQSVIQEAKRRADATRIEIQALELKYLEAIEEIELPLLELAKKMAEKVLGMELSISEDKEKILFENLRKMLYEVIDQNKVMVEVNPEHLATLEKRDLKKELNLPEKMEMSYIAGQELQSGEARIQTEDYSIDGTYENQFRNLHEQLKNEKS